MQKLRSSEQQQLRRAHDTMTTKKQWIEPKEFKITDINAKTVLVPPCDDKERFIVSTVKNKNQIHHTLMTPKELNDQGKFTLEFDPAMTSAYYLQMGDDGTHSYVFYMDVFSKWNEYYQETQSTINAMLSRCTSQTTSDELKALLFESLVKKDYSIDVIQRAYDDNAPLAEHEVTPVLFRQVATCVLIQTKMDQDPDGTRLMKFCATTKQLYCKHLDSHMGDKERIYSSCRIDRALIKEPCEKLVDDIFKWTLYKDPGPLQDKIDYSKSPGIGIKLFVYLIKAHHKTEGKILIPGTGQMIATSIYNMFSRKMSDAGTAISTFEEFSQFTYLKGDNNKGKTGFRLSQLIKCMEICVFWGEVTKRASFQFKAVDLTIFKRIPFGGGTRALSENDVQKRLLAGQRALAALGLDQNQMRVDDATEQTDNGNNDNNKTSDDDGRQGEKRLGDAPNDDRATKRANLFEPL